MTILMIFFVASGFVLSGLSIPLMLGKIPPNGLYGLRVRKTMEHPEIWYPVNAYGGKWLFVTGLIIILASLGLTFIPGIGLDVYPLAVLAVLVVVFTISIVAIVSYMNRLA